MIKINSIGITAGTIVFSIISSASYGSYHFVLGKIDDAAKLATLLANTKYLAQTSKLKIRHKKDLAQLKLKHKKELANVKIKQRAKAKIQRAVTVLPVIGLASLVMFEKIEFDGYADEMSVAVNNLVMDEYREFGEYYKDFMNLKASYR